MNAQPDIFESLAALEIVPAKSGAAPPAARETGGAGAGAGSGGDAGHV